MNTRRFLAAFTALTMGSLLGSSAWAQEEEMRLVPKSSGSAFYHDAHRYVAWPNHHQIYDIEVNGGSMSGANNITHYLSGVSIVKPSSSTKETWLFGPAPLSKINDHIRMNDARVLDLELVAEFGLPATTTEGKDYYAVVTRNHGAEGKGWYWWWEVTESHLLTSLAQTNSRLIDLEQVSGHSGSSSARYVAVAIVNTGADYRPFKWDTNLTESEVQIFLAANPSYRARHLGYEGVNSGIRWNVIIEQTSEIASTQVVFNQTESGLNYTANSTNKRIASLAYSRFNSRYAAILVPTWTLSFPFGR